MAPRLIKCQYCTKVDSLKEAMVRGKKGFYHPQCYELFEKEQKQREVELTEWDNLYNHILKLHNLEILPTPFIVRLQELRNGTMTLNGKKLKKYKQGVKYSAILKAYELSESKIKYALNTKHFETDIQALNYCYMIMVNEINAAYERLRTQQQNKKVNKATVISDIEQLEDERPIKIEKKKYKRDISDLL